MTTCRSIASSTASWRRPATATRQRHRRLDLPGPQGRVFQGAVQARHRRHGARQQSRFRQQPVLHHVRRGLLPQRPVHRGGRSGRAAWTWSTSSNAASRRPIPTASSRCRWRPTRHKARWHSVSPRTRERSGASCRFDAHRPVRLCLPEDRIALRPVSPRDAARLLVVRPARRPSSRTASCATCRACCGQAMRWSSTIPK